MPRLFGQISDVFELANRGCFVLVSDEHIEPDVKLHIGDEVAIVCDGSQPIRTSVKAIELGNKGNSGFVGVLLGPEVKKIDIASGSSLMKE